MVALTATAGYALWTPDRERSALEAAYLLAPTDMVDVAVDGAAGNHLRLHLRDSGPKNAPAVVLIHGFGGSLHSWQPWAEALAAHHRVIRFDLPGCGLSPPDPTGDYTDARSQQVLIALLNQLGIARASVVGHSMGGRIAWTFAATHPDRVNRLVLVAPDGFASPGFAYGAPPEASATVQLMRYTLPAWLLRMSLQPAYADPAFMTEALATRYHELMLAPGARDALITRMQQTTLVDPTPLLRRITAPTLLVWGAADAMIPVANAADYLKALPNATLITLPHVGHLPQEEAAQQSIGAVADFLK